MHDLDVSRKDITRQCTGMKQHAAAEQAGSVYSSRAENHDTLALLDKGRSEGGEIHEGCEVFGQGATFERVANVQDVA